MNISSSVVVSSTAPRRLDSLDSIDSNTSPKKKWDVARDSFKVNKLRAEAKEELVRQHHHKEQQKTMKKPKFDLDYGGILTSMKNKHDAAQAKSPNKTSDAKSYLKSRREKARRVRHGNMLNLIDQNIERLSPVKTSPATTTTTLDTKKVNIDIPRLSPDTKKKKKKKKIKKTTKDKEEGKAKKPKRKSSFSLLAPSLGSSSSSSPTTSTTAADSSSTSTHGSRLRNVLNPFRSHSRGKSGGDENNNDNSSNSGRSTGSRSLSLTSTGKSSRRINKTSASSAANTSDKTSTPSTKEGSDSPSRSLASGRLFRSPSSVKQRRRGRRSSSKVSSDSEKDAEMKAIVDKVLRNYPKERCKTLEDHRQYAFAELLTAQSNSSYSSSNSSNDMMSSAENIQDLKAMLDSHLASSVKSALKPNKSNDNNGGDASGNDTYDRSPRNDRSNSPTKNKMATESILRFGGKATTSSSPRASKKPSIHSPKRNQHVFVDSKLKKTVSLSPRKVADEEPVTKSPRVPLSRHLSAPPTPTSKRSKSGEKMFNDSNTTCLTETSMTDFDGGASEVKLLIPVVKLLTTDKNGRIGKYTGTIDADTGKPHGINGRLQYEDGGSYEGDWSSGSYSGYGTHVNWNGDVYEGNFLENSKHGTGCYRYHDGRRKFEGRYDTGERVEGRMLYGDGSVYEGQWKGGKRQGRGTYTFRDGSVYKGEFFDDVIHGVGRIVWPDGSKYIGDWKQGHRHGLGKEYTPTGRLSYEGRWKESSPVA
eukprot:CAMPEP_0113481758 /NCGR_PEP_ID=MMETSP0014_2-20120614/22571_1 /TAXON_ID=2857 /ORGANISM="Nitzschia sp." /LENGTH=757 /DNA_ID=CAMNT_0000375259 /DNA_START=139 /DNA_END=2412 /DNA_ORIENTATION=+ /assembly_acc=CAM_ASM_000159